MSTIEEKANAHINSIFGKLIDKYKTAPWNEFRDALVQIYLAGAKEALAGQWQEIDESCHIVPSKYTVCLCRYNDGGYTVAIFDGVDKWTDPSNGEIYLSPMWNVIDGDYVIGDEITHWMPIPEIFKG